MIDVHTHILSGVDDGSRNVGMTTEMLRRAREAGITQVIATPHVYCPEDQKRNRAALSAAREIARPLRMPIVMGCEFNYRALLKTDIGCLDAFCMGSTRCILLELSQDRLLPGWDALISELQDHGYFPIIAHPERYAYIQRDFSIAREMCELGCEMQVDAGGLMASLLSGERRTARKLLKEGMAHYIASDAHRPEDYDTFEKAYKVFSGEWPSQNRLKKALRTLQEERKRRGQGMET